MMHAEKQIVVGMLDEQRYALRLSVVERLVRAVEITPLPQAPDIVLGVVNVQGRVIPVINVRKRFHLPDRPIELSDRFIVARTAQRPVIVVMDTVIGVIEYLDGQIMQSADILPSADYVDGVVKLEDGLIFIHDLDTFLSLEEEQTLSDALLIG